MDAAASSHHLPRVLESNSYNQELSSKVGCFIIIFKNRLSRLGFLKYTTIMFVIFIHIKSRDKVNSAQSKAPKRLSDFRLLTLSSIWRLPSL